MWSGLPSLKLMRSPETQFNPESANSPEPVKETETSVSYLGVALEKATIKGGDFVPKREQYEDFINDKEIALPLQRDIAVAFLNGEPMLVDGGTSLGKTTTVRKMCSELGWEVHYANLNGATDVEDLMGRYIPNPHKRNIDDPEYIFADGKVTSGLRQEKGKVKVIILDEFNSSAPNILIRLHEVLDALERGGDVVLSEDASEAVSVNKQRTKIIALMNPPGKGYFGREPLDPAQLRRWVYKKLPTELPEGTFSHSTDALFGAESLTQQVPKEAFLLARDQVLTPEQLQEIPGLPEILAKYKEFHKAAKELLKNRKIAEDQPQPFMYDDRMEPRRVRDFILRFYNGDINETFQNALGYYYANKLETADDQKKLTELIRLVEYKPKDAESKRRPLAAPDVAPETGAATPDRPETTKGETNYEKAKEIMEENFFGYEEILKAWGPEVADTIKDKDGSPRPAWKEAVKDTPPILYSEAELKDANKNGEMLILRVATDKSGKPLTMKRLNEIGQPRLTSDEGKLLYKVDWFKDEDFYKNKSLTSEWALVKKDFVPGSTGKDYIEQTRVLRDYLKGLGTLTKEELGECSDAILNSIRDLMKFDMKAASRQLSDLLVNKNHRRSPGEILYDWMLLFKNGKGRLLEKTYDWSSARTSDGRLVNFGYADAGGAYVYGYHPVYSSDFLGVVSVR